MRTFATALFCLAALAAEVAQAQMLTPVWTEVGDHGTVARVIVSAASDCPTVTVDGSALKMAESVASAAAESKPDLVIHVGDYFYREEPCPAGFQASCGGTPAGDTWEAWQADFFAPARNLLAAAPWVFSTR